MLGRSSSKRASSVRPDMYMKRILNVGDAHLLEAVHAGERDHDRDALAAVAGRQMKPGRERPTVGQANPRRLDVVVGEPRVLRVTLALPVVVEAVLLVVLVDRPLRGAPVDARHEVVLARRDETLALLGGTGLGFTTAGDRLERRGGVGELRDALAERGEVGVGLGTAGHGKIDGARLVPVHPDRADDVVEQPALLGPAPRQRPVSGSGGVCVVDQLERTVGHEVTPSEVAAGYRELYCGALTQAREVRDEEAKREWRGPSGPLHRHRRI